MVRLSALVGALLFCGLPVVARGAPAGSEASSDDRPAPRPQLPPDPRAPPDVRRGETYDGRALPGRWTDALRIVPRVLLFVPRAVLAGLFQVSAAVVDWLERSGVGRAVRRICYAYDGRLTVYPTVLWEYGLDPLAGARLGTDLLFGRSRRATLFVWGAAGAERVWQVGLRFLPLGARTSGAAPRRLRLAVAATYQRRDDVPFYGVGYLRQPWVPPGGPTDEPMAPEKTRLTREVAGASIALFARWAWFTLETRVGFDWRRLRNGRPGLERFSFSRVYGAAWPEWDQGLPAFAGQLTAHFGRPARRPIPRVGLRGSVTARVVAGEATNSRLLLVDGEAEGFVRLTAGPRLLGLRVRLAGLGSLSGGTLPLLHLPTLGGPDSLRGFVTGRFVGETVAWVAFEYHAALHRRFWLSLFVDWGGAFRSFFREFGLDRIDLSGGAAVALRLTRDNWMRLQVAGSREGATVHIGWRGWP